MKTTFLNIHEAVSRMEIIDTHEHLCNESQVSEAPDLLSMYLFHYLKVDVLTAGLTQEHFKLVLNTEIPVMERWKLVEPFWEMSRFTGYGQSLDISANAIYGADRIDSNTIVELSKAFGQQNHIGHYKHVLTDLCKIKTSINDMSYFEGGLFNFVARIDPMLSSKTRQEFIGFGDGLGITLHSLADYELACEAYLDSVIKKGVVGLKCGLAYDRSLYFEKVSRSTAETIFTRLLAQHDCSNVDLKCFQDYIMHYVLALADKRRMVIQIHTGLLEGINYNLAYSNPLLLNNIFMEYTNIKFDLFHMGYPFHHAITALVKMFPNVYVDMCWAHIVSPPTCIEMLGEWLETVPVNKIMGFGGDYCFVDGVYGHQYLARKNISKALANKVEYGLIDITKAKMIAKQLLYDNPKNLFQL